jgi:diguanylate cyclase (GGDEF)-like protein
MTDLLDTVAGLTILRDRDELESNCANLLFGLAQAGCLSLWRAQRDGAGVTLRLRISLPVRLALSPAIALDQARAEWRESFATRRYVQGAADVFGVVRHIFPICSEREVIGLIEILRPPVLGPLPEQTIAGFLRVYSNQLGLLDYGDRDELTGLLNRRTFNTYFRQVLAPPVPRAVIAVADIDFFKRINDRFGHPYGDEVLILLARLMANVFSGRDGLFRFGGEEFVVILTDISTRDATLALEDFRRAVAAENFPQVGQVTVSIGHSLVLRDDSGAAAFGRADEALYCAKQLGRNQVQCREGLVRDGTLAGKKQSGGAVELF